MRTWLGGLAVAGVLLAPGAGPAFAEGPAIGLYHAISTKDDVVVGIANQELEGEGEPTTPLDVLGDRIAGAGYVTAWLYGLRRGADGSPEWAPQRRIILLAANLLRIEPMTPSEKVVAPTAAAPAPAKR